jgi:hypothetical protein
VAKRFALLALCALASVGLASGENIDPSGNGAQYAWAENVGWLNAEPAGQGGPGLEVETLELGGWMWGENIGWVSLSCTNTSSCGTVSYGVANDGCGTLSGYAWAENIGWINFAPTCGGDSSCGVKIGPKTGIFTGRAWAANAGWITFASSGPHPYGVATGWRRAVPPAVASLAAAKQAGELVLSWPAVTGATTYDVVSGSLSTLRASGGNYETATESCVADDVTATSFPTSGAPAPGDGDWFLVRGGNCGGNGSYDDGAQTAPRDAGIAASANDCP